MSWAEWQHINQCVCVCVLPQLQQASVPVSYTVTPVPPHSLAAPMCTGQHLPPTCSSQVPACSVVFSTGQHYHPVRGTRVCVCGFDESRESTLCAVQPLSFMTRVKDNAEHTKIKKIRERAAGPKWFVDLLGPLLPPSGQTWYCIIPTLITCLSPFLPDAPGLFNAASARALRLSLAAVQ